ncbi:hypothetical protein H0H81_009222 [Sphagnurus paluster]|uniref:Uncharacterized protein n=1 Tax=Sphagnurus paluster TaxID=117069 RepID=A0A9P7GIJ6_9AGAR|nr:hypothetical protein H0H81_009222 [Sphagnurus paluster]
MNVRFIFGHLYESELAKDLATACHHSSTTDTPYRLSYTGHGKSDAFLCPLVTFFHAAIDLPDAQSFLTYFIGIGAPLVAIPLIESSRAGRSLFIAYPLIFGLLSQTITVGVTFPIYWLLFIMSGGANNTNPRDAKITQSHAEAIVFGLLIGAVIPSVGMLVLNDPQVTAMWQPYPIYVSIAQLLHLALRPPSKHPQPGYHTIRFLYLTIFLICSSVHISTIWPFIRDAATIQKVYLPSTTVPEVSALVGFRVLHFLKWDLALGFGASIIATLWFASNWREVIAITGWSLIATPLLGPGAALTGSALWRESSLHMGLSKTKQE